MIFILLIIELKMTFLKMATYLFNYIYIYLFNYIYILFIY